MKRFIFLALSVLSFLVWASPTVGKEPQRVQRDDCHLSFSAPENIEYVEVDGAISTGKDECYMAFKYAGDLRIKSVRRMPAMPEDWRAMTDFSLTVKSIPIADSLAQIESEDGAPQHGLFKKISKEHVPLSGGDLYVVSYVAQKPTESMRSASETREMIFVAGNNVRSIVFPLYSGDRLSRAGREKERIFKDLFSSLKFYN